LDPNCKKGVRDVQKMTMHFLRHMDSTFDQRSTVLLAQSKIPSLDEAISTMIQEESRIRLHAGSGRLPCPKSALAAANTGNTKYRGESRQCYNCDEVGHLKHVCPKPLKERDTGGRGSLGVMVAAAEVGEVEEEATRHICWLQRRRRKLLKILLMRIRHSWRPILRH
jgi:Zinc knuckle